MDDPRARRAALLVHGGAWQIPDAEVDAHLRGLLVALEIGRAMLEAGRSAVSAVVETLAILEDNPAFDAGLGSVLTTSGGIEMDAAVMDGRMRAGAVAVVSRVRHPIRLAHALQQRGRHVFLSGSGAHEAARFFGLEEVDPESLVVERERIRLAGIRANDRFRVPDPFDHPEARTQLDFTPRLCFGGDAEGPSGCEEAGTSGRAPDDPNAASGPPPVPGGTVGAVAIDREGEVAAATSTGGAPGKWPGRIGDSPVIGAGTFADGEYGACSATGWGESILRAALAADAVRRLGEEAHPSLAARDCIRRFQRRVGGLGGLILIDRRGRLGWAFNTPRMARALWSEGQGPRVWIDPSD